MKIVMYDKDNKIVVKDCSKLEYSMLTGKLILDESDVVDLQDFIRAIDNPT